MNQSTTPLFGQKDPNLVYIPRPGAYAIVIEGRQVGVIQTARGYFLPGGGIEPGETPEQALQREILEECGCALMNIRPIGAAVEYLHSEAGENYELQCSFFLAMLGRMVEIPSEKDHALVWLDVEAAKSQIHRPSQRWAIRNFSNYGVEKNFP